MSPALEYLERYKEFRAPAFPTSEACPLPPKSNIIRFLDRHLDEALILKRIVLASDLSSNLATVADEHLAAMDLSAMSIGVLGMTYGTYSKPSSIVNANCVAYLQSDGIGYPCCQLGSSRFIHPEQPLQTGVLCWTQLPWLQPDWDEKEPHPFVLQNYALQVSEVIPDIPDPFKPEIVERVVAMRNRFPYCSLGVFFSPGAHDYLLDMASLGADESFPWEMNSECNVAASPSVVQQTRDAPHSLWELPLIPRRHGKVRGEKRRCLPEHSKGDISSLPRTTDGPHKIAHYVQRAWVNAVLIDATTIIFDCGRSVRIGIRNRKTQTLYLSDLIESSATEGLPYGKIMMGLYFGIAHDLVQRYELMRTIDPVQPFSRKRQMTMPPMDVPNAKHPRLGANAEGVARNATIELSQKRAEKEKLVKEEKIFSSSILALYLRIDVYNSPTPLILLAPGTEQRDVYTHNEYLSMILHSRLGRGATGTVYRGRLGSRPSMGKMSSLFVVKVATTLARLGRLRHEYGIYKQLHSAKVQGIPCVFGYYENVDHEAGVLILADCGRPLGERVNNVERRVELTPDESDQLRDVVKAIHAAGVLHGDIRSWNMLLDSNGQVSIIDFDSSSTHGSNMDYNAETERLERFIRGVYIDDDRVLVPQRKKIVHKGSEDSSDSESDDESDEC